jgi:hypothetical protein
MKTLLQIKLNYDEITTKILNACLPCLVFHFAIFVITQYIQLFCFSVLKS